MSKIKCPECGSDNILTERRLDGFHACLECLHRWKIRESQPKKTLFHRITASPEALAEKLVYLVMNSYNGAVNYYWRSTIIDKAWKTKQEAIAATVAKLKEPEG